MRSNPIVDATANVREYGHLTAKPHSGDSSSDKRIDASFNSPPKMHTDIAGRDSSRTVFLYTSKLSTHQHARGHRPPTADAIAESVLKLKRAAPCSRRSNNSIPMRLCVATRREHQKDGGHKQIKLSFLPVSSNH